MGLTEGESGLAVLPRSKSIADTEMSEAGVHDDFATSSGGVAASRRFSKTHVERAAAEVGYGVPPGAAMSSETDIRDSGVPEARACSLSAPSSETDIRESGGVCSVSALSSEAGVGGWGVSEASSDRGLTRSGVAEMKRCCSVGVGAPWLHASRQ